MKFHRTIRKKKCAVKLHWEDWKHKIMLITTRYITNRKKKHIRINGLKIKGNIYFRKKNINRIEISNQARGDEINQNAKEEHWNRRMQTILWLTVQLGTSKLNICPAAAEDVKVENGVLGYITRKLIFFNYLALLPYLLKKKPQLIGSSFVYLISTWPA